MDILITTEEFDKLKFNDTVDYQCKTCKRFTARTKKNILAWLKKGFTTFICTSCKSLPKGNCKNCAKEIFNNQNIFCSSSCAASFNNKHRQRKCSKQPVEPNKERIKQSNTTEIKCSNCENYFKGSKNRKFCSCKCSSDYTHTKHWLPIKEEIRKGVTKFSESIDTNHRYFRNYLIEEYGPKCMDCGWDKVNPKTNKTPIELEHIDGNCTNNKLSNLKLICPNCHSLTLTYKSLNKSKIGSPRYNKWKESIRSCALK